MCTKCILVLLSIMTAIIIKEKRKKRILLFSGDPETSCFMLGAKDRALKIVIIMAKILTFISTNHLFKTQLNGEKTKLQFKSKCQADEIKKFCFDDAINHRFQPKKCHRNVTHRSQYDY